jgi:hypothetical protein
MDFNIITEGEVQILHFGDRILICWTALHYNLMDYEQLLEGKGHISFVYNLN